MENIGDEFHMARQKVQLVGNPALQRAKISSKAMIKTLKKEGGGILVEYKGMEETSKK